jgi:hypothetical protein
VILENCFCLKTQKKQDQQHKVLFAFVVVDVVFRGKGKRGKKIIKGKKERLN